MVYIRGQAADFDEWEAQGNPGWGWRDVLPHYKRIENHFLGASELHGAGGPLHVSETSDQAHPLCQAFFRAGEEVGLPFNRDLNGTSPEGVGHYHFTIRDGLRMSASRAFLWPAMRRANLRIETMALATRIVVEDGRAVAVEYTRDGARMRTEARREIILSAGSINSPQLLQVSGIGPAPLLKSLGIEVVCDRPAVGQNLQDHLCYDHVYRSRQPTLNDELYPWWGKVRAALRYIAFRRGPLSLSVNQAGGFFRDGPDRARPNIQLYFSPLSYERAPPGVRALTKPDPFSGFLVSVSPCRPTSRGHLEIRSADPSEAPAIHPNYLSTNSDIAELLAG
ncbi:MAG: GMC family oxidoreductase, partial [Stellaceae bacterium]